MFIANTIKLSTHDTPSSPLTSMTYIAQDVLDGKPVNWMEKVSDSGIRHQI
ncbi:hypothetical protein AVDCRST_MAG94-5691 [uncultured Leptolyngbya sp.]|uniref:Uncharacterized protein n=2 Tax=Cyanophyceae TaxID=3028117 RepID=A0A6J4NV48_9CYAN|nr:hypothetical protein AVDCRST_MAG94-5691 [uncultured Leptolyngbya sp.]CAA9560880.1 hypothetical protein AVDCRST_MAG81-618 [uncultured Synechococcales cyanobacterium]